ncbi:hypothetical protein V6N13_002131 [Hibiscus sabdariffa]
MISDEGYKAMVEGFCVVDDEYDARVRKKNGEEVISFMESSGGGRTTGAGCGVGWRKAARRRRAGLACNASDE